MARCISLHEEELLNMDEVEKKLQEMDELGKKEIDLVKTAMLASAERVKKLRCPGCGRSIRIAYVPGGKGDMWLKCKPCGILSECHGVGDPPPWFSELGGTVVTEPD